MIEEQLKKIKKINKNLNQIALREYKLKMIDTIDFFMSKNQTISLLNVLNKNKINKPIMIEYLKLSYLVLEDYLKNMILIMILCGNVLNADISFQKKFLIKH